jgi:Peptidase family S41
VYPPEILPLAMHARYRRRRIALVVGVPFIASCAPFHVPPPPALPPSAVGSTITRDDAVSDVDALFHTIEDVHPDLYANRPRDSVIAARARIVAALPSSLSRAELWMRLAPLVAALGDGHTSIAMPREEARRMQTEGALVFPPSVVRDDAGQVIISAALLREPDLREGDRVLSLNGLGADSLLGAWMNESSGESDRFRAAQVTSAFRDYVVIHGIRAPYTLVTERSDGTRHSISLPGITQDSLRAIVARNRVSRTTASNFTYQLAAPHVGYMDFRSMAGNLESFKTDIAAMFGRVTADSDRVLIVDLRANGGGDSRLGDEFLRYVTTAPYRMSAAKAWKMSAEYRGYLKTFLPTPLRWIHAWSFNSLGRQLMKGPDGTIVTFPEAPTAHATAQPFFSGRMCVLIGPQTFSSATDFADAIKTYHLGTLIGEETGGRPNGFGEAYIFRLPHSQLAVSVSSALFVRASGDTTDHRGVVPDVVVTPADSDRRAGRDPVVERATTC